MDKILMKNMAFYGYHGVLPEEKKIGQKFFIDAILYLPLKEAGQTDDLTQSVSYAAVYETIKNIVENKPFDLLEALAETLCNQILATYLLVQKVQVTVKKPEAPVAGIFDYFGVEIERERME